MVSKCSDICLLEKFDNVIITSINNIHIYLTKTKEVVFRMCNLFLDILPGLPAVLVSTDRVEDVIKFTGVYVQSNVNFDSHLNFVLSQCSLGLHLIKSLGCQGLHRTRLESLSYFLFLILVCFVDYL